MKQKEMAWNKNKKLSDLEEVARERAQNLLQRANKLRMEQEEELKDMNKVGLFLLSGDFLPLPLCSYSLWGQGEGLVWAGLECIGGEVTCLLDDEGKSPALPEPQRVHV